MPLTFENVTCVADAHDPKRVRVSAQLNGPLPAGHVIRTVISSNGKKSPGNMKAIAGEYRRAPVAMPDDPVRVELRVVPDGEPRPILAQFDEEFDLGRGS